VPATDPPVPPAAEPVTSWYCGSFEQAVEIASARNSKIFEGRGAGLWRIGRTPLAGSHMREGCGAIK
jgi:hypothetical protein